MAGFTATVLAIGAGLGAVSQVKQVKEQKKAAEAQRAAIARQETAAREAAALEGSAAETGAEVALGSDGSGAGPANGTSTRRRGGASAVLPTNAALGGASAARLGGL